MMTMIDLQKTAKGWSRDWFKHGCGSLPAMLREVFRAARENRLEKLTLTYETDKMKYKFTVPGRLRAAALKAADERRKAQG